jgi:hypothetical protein
MNLLGLLAVIALVTSLVYLQLKWGPDYNKTFSRLVTQKRSSIIYYLIVFFVFLSLFSFFIVTNFTAQLNLPASFAWIYFLGAISQLICVTVPEAGGYKTKIHLIAAGVMSASAFVQVMLVIIFVQLSAVSFVTCVLCLLLMASVWLAIILKHRSTKYELGLQSVYFVSYLSALMFAYYIR